MSQLFQVFDRVAVDYLMLGNARVSWEISPHFFELEPWTFQLQVAESDVDNANWTNVGSPVVNTFFNIDPTQRAYGKELNVFYRVKLTTFLGVIYYSKPADVMGHLDPRSWRLAKEIVRKEQLRLNRLHVGVEGVVLKAKRSGTLCEDCIDPRTKEVTDSNCPTCFGLRWEGGYYSPYSAVYSDVTVPDSELQRDEEGTGMNNPQAITGMFVASPFLSAMDIWVNKTTDQRYHIRKVTPRTHIRSVPILTVAQMRLIPFDNVVYKVPI